MLLSRFVKCAALSVFVVPASAGGTAHAFQCWEGLGEGARPGQNLEALQGRLKNSALVCWSHAQEARGNDCRPNNGWANHDIYGNHPDVVYHFHIPHPHHMPYQSFGFHPGAVPYNWSMGGMGMPQPYR